MNKVGLLKRNMKVLINKYYIQIINPIVLYFNYLNNSTS